MTVVALTPSDHGRAVSVDQGDEVIIRLPETPTSGYRWEIVRLDDPLAVLDDSFELAPDPQLGSGGIRQFRLRAARAGSARVEMKLYQAWEGDASVTDRASFTVSVSEA